VGLAEALLEAGDAAAALAEFERVRETESDRVRAVYGAGRAAERAGDGDAARRHYRNLLEITARAEPGRPEVKRARAVAGSG
jgi:predicted TPR repeat methyltransferase